MTQQTSFANPETYPIPQPTLHVPNSPFPVLVYRNVLPSSPTPSSIRSAIEPNHWLQGGVFKHIPTHHFHSVTHECYAVFKGSSRLLLGRGPWDDPPIGNSNGNGSGKGEDVVITLGVGDAIVLPAGVAHCSIESEEGYEYVGLYPEGSPHWDNNYCKADEEETMEKTRNARAVPIPDCDPIFGLDGPLTRIWKEAIAPAGQ